MSGLLKVTASSSMAVSKDLSTPATTVALNYSLTLTDTLAARVYGDSLSGIDDTGAELDLAGSLTDDFGRTITWTHITSLVVKAATANVANVHIGGAAANQWYGFVGAANDIVVIPPGGVFVWSSAAGAAVTAGTADQLKYCSSAPGAGNNVAFDIWITGKHA